MDVKTINVYDKKFFMGRWFRAQIHPLYLFINILQSKEKSRDVMNASYHRVLVLIFTFKGFGYLKS